MYIKRIITHNIQNHAEVVVDLPEKGLVVFTGDNSNGKSVIVRTTRAILLNEITKPRKRASLVNRESMFGEITYIRGDDVVLTVHIAREASATYVKYQEPGQEPIVRALADKSYRELITRFGWHVDTDTGITLNIAEEEDSLLFYKTSYKTNAKIITTATQDTSAQVVLDNFSEIMALARKSRDVNVQKARTYNEALQSLEVYDVKLLSEYKAVLEKYYKRLSTLYIPKLPEIKAVPKVHFSDIAFPTLPTIRYPRIMNVKCSIPDITGIASELKTLKANKCPTCGRGFDCEC